MTWRGLVVLLIALLVGLPAAQHAFPSFDGGHVALLKHAPRTPPSSARAGAVGRPPAPTPPTLLAERPSGAPPDRVPAVAPAVPFVPPRV